ncbi:GNAT family N-acetyltransferase [Salisaeta longa]|uniref:GNAT family N-acetyltransferase n=1 Tax=Salisaeta longa TaxID=503170 RepID=UPI0003B3C734|nr:GNAT family N-acyltransferase [Salisaeta longa]
MVAASEQSRAASIPDETFASGAYEAFFARTVRAIRAAQCLRYQVFNMEKAQGLAAGPAGRDADAYDPACHHLIVQHSPTQSVVGTYRMQTHAMAQAGNGWYSTSLFDLSSWPLAVQQQAVEVGRACIARDHRALPVLNLLWRGIGAYLAHHEARYLFGCCSVDSQDPAVGVALHRYLQNEGVVHPTLHAPPQPGHACVLAGDDAPSAADASAIPRLMRVYLRMGTRICSSPAIDRAFKTIDFLAFFDINALSDSAARFFGYDR